MQVILGRRLYYNIITGVILYDTGERMGENIVDSTIEDDFKYSLELRNQNRDIVDYLQLEPGQYNEEFSEAVTYRVNPETKELEFGYEINNDYTGFQSPYKKQIDELKKENEEYKNRIADLEIILSETLLNN
ncbi:hypothetical protein P9D39_24385 [Heyndrickxia oleronia]|uniref:Uncharacterized protein n=1 Tax=Heyndrickxia oleronia TaxID=38875 RepID=A0A8E2LG77_9BACI|nr:hypothetical protein [Heyndrickxia oleronia]MEC1377368.1 hypothetical protein [Heyndrickxia oleronia]OOP70163.1 hypothetical protein BWZ43_01060 [Heyndrickxia oleronia]QQZ06007.1 hypothetical protein I5818_06010 [Heyndrickxia oleronia]